MSALTEADHEEITDTLLAARERIEHLMICGAALQAENDRLKNANKELTDALCGMVEMFKDAPTLEQFAFDEPPEPRTQWDYEAILMLGDARNALAKAGELK